MAEKHNIFGHQSIAKPQPAQSRANQMSALLQDEPAQEAPAAVAKEMPIADLEQLIYLGGIQDTKTIAGYAFNMRTLTNNEQNEVWMSVSFLTDQTKFLVIKTALLARAITSVNGRALDVLYPGKDYRELTPERRCVKVVESWQQPLIDELYEFYSELLERSRKVIKPEDVKK